MSTTYSPSRSIGSARLQLGLGGVSRLRSSSVKKPPEPLRRAVADCLSSSSSAVASSGSFSAHGSSSAAVSEASRTLRDYLATPSTTDMAYSVILEHTISERERSPAVVSRCVALLKRHLLRYKPSEETLLQIDRFCVSTIAECDISTSWRMSPWSQSLSQQSGTSAASTNISPLPVSSFASAALVKSLNYVRSLVAQHIPKRPFQAAAFSGGFTASRQSLPTLSSLLSKSFNTQLIPANNGESSEVKDASVLSVSNTNFEKKDVLEDLEYIAQDVLAWRWPGELDSPLHSTESDRFENPQNIRMHSFFEVGAAALLVGDMDVNLKNSKPSIRLRTADRPYPDQLPQPSSVTTATDSVSARPHLRAITASKRTKHGPHQIWEDSPVNTIRPRARQLFQYRHYSEQQPLRLNTLEVGEVLAAVCMESSAPIVNVMTVSSRLSSYGGKPSIDVAVSVLIKLVIDMYVMDSGTAAPLTLSMLEEMLSSPRSASRARAFDLILNLGVHAHLLEPMINDEAIAIEEEYSQESYINNDDQLSAKGMMKTESLTNDWGSAIDKFESWILSIFYEILLLLVQIEEEEESVWASGFSCLLYFVCDRGKIWRNRLKGLDIRVIRALLEISRKHSWAEVVHTKLICIFANMFYQVPNDVESASGTTRFLPGQVDLVGGVDFIFCEYSLANTRCERRNLYLVLFEYILHQTNEMCRAGGVSEYGDDEIRVLASLLTVADAPEAFYISIKLGVEGIMEILRSSIFAALSRYPNSERLNMLLEDITGKFDAIISSFTKLNKEFTHLMQLTKSHKLFKSIRDNIQGNSDCMKVNLSWSTLHSLLHSDRFAYRQNGYVWLGDLLIAEISEGDIWSNIRNFQQRIALADHDALEGSDVPLPILLLCGLLKSRNNFMRWGFLFVLERLLMRCKCLLDEDKQHSSSGEGGEHAEGDRRLEKANAVIDIMTSSLSLVAQLNETDRINILKMCEILFSQLFLKVPLATSMAFEDALHNGTLFSGMDGSKKVDDSELSLQRENFRLESLVENIDSSAAYNNCETSSMAALLLRGHAIVPMKLITRVPAVLFYWPLIQLAGAATDNIALGVAVGSKGKGNLPGATSDIRATLLLLLIGKCTADAAAFQEVGGQEFFRELLDDTDSRVAYYSSAFLLKRMMIEEPEKYQRLLQNLVLRAQQSNNEKLLENPYLQMRGILQLSNE